MEDILQAMERIETFVHGMTFDDFLADDKTTSAVVWQLEIVGEAARFIPDEMICAGGIPRSPGERWLV